MAGVDAAADLGMMVLDRLGDRFDLGVAVARTVVVDADGDVELLDQLVEIVEAAGSGSAEDILKPQLLANSKMRRLASASVPKWHDTVADDASPGPRQCSRLIVREPSRRSFIGTWAGYDSQ